MKLKLISFLLSGLTIFSFVPSVANAATKEEKKDIINTIKSNQSSNKNLITYNYTKTEDQEIYTLNHMYTGKTEKVIITHVKNGKSIIQSVDVNNKITTYEDKSAKNNLTKNQINSLIKLDSAQGYWKYAGSSKGNTTVDAGEAGATIGVLVGFLGESWVGLITAVVTTAISNGDENLYYTYNQYYDSEDFTHRKNELTFYEDRRYEHYVKSSSYEFYSSRPGN